MASQTASCNPSKPEFRSISIDSNRSDITSVFNHYIPNHSWFSHLIKISVKSFPSKINQNPSYINPKHHYHDYWGSLNQSLICDRWWAYHNLINVLHGIEPSKEAKNWETEIGSWFPWWIPDGNALLNLDTAQWLFESFSSPWVTRYRCEDLILEPSHVIHLTWSIDIRL